MLAFVLFMMLFLTQTLSGMNVKTDKMFPGQISLLNSPKYIMNTGLLRKPIKTLFGNPALEDDHREKKKIQLFFFKSPCPRPGQRRQAAVGSAAHRVLRAVPTADEATSVTQPKGQRSRTARAAPQGGGKGRGTQVCSSPGVPAATMPTLSRTGEVRPSMLRPVTRRRSGGRGRCPPSPVWPEKRSPLPALEKSRLGV